MTTYRSCALLLLLVGACSSEEPSSSPSGPPEGSAAGQGGQAQGGATIAGGSAGSAGQANAMSGQGGQVSAGGKAGGGMAGASGSAAVESGPATVSGIVSRAFGMDRSPAGGVEVEAIVDLDGDGAIGQNERFTTTTADDGSYSLGYQTKTRRRAVFAFRSVDDAKVFRTLHTDPGATISLDVTLAALATLEPTASRLALPGQTLTLDGLPTGTTGKARVFNPATEAKYFPGNFADEKGTPLRSGVFAAIELKDTAGSPLTALDSPAAVAIEVPIDTWPIIIDTSPDTDRIEVPLYAFDEVNGTWRREREGWLVDSAGQPIPESELSAIRDKTRTAAVRVRGDLDHFSYWNLDWPIPDTTCVTARLVYPDGTVAKNVTYDATGLDATGGYLGHTSGTSDSGGALCVDVGRSEQPGEDFDGSGTAGETFTFDLLMAIDGAAFAKRGSPLPSSPASCGSADGCLDLGTLVLGDDLKVLGGLCKVTGVVRDKHGAPLAGAWVWGYDDALPSSVYDTLCANGCNDGAQTMADGTFEIDAPILTKLTLASDYYSKPDGDPKAVTRTGWRQLTGCPSAPVELTLDQGLNDYALTLSVDAGQISWSPAKGANHLYAWAADTLWDISGSPANPLTPPIAWGAVPPGATQIYPEGGTPPTAPKSGDYVLVEGDGQDDDGYPYWIYGSTQLP